MLRPARDEPGDLAARRAEFHALLAAIAAQGPSPIVTAATILGDAAASSPAAHDRDVLHACAAAALIATADTTTYLGDGADGGDRETSVWSTTAASLADDAAWQAALAGFLDVLSRWLDLVAADEADASAAEDAAASARQFAADTLAFASGGAAADGEPG